MYCPSSKTDPNGFLMASESRIHEIRYLPNRLVRYITHYPTGNTTEQILFEGLVRMASTSGLSWVPKSDLSKLFPLESKAVYTFQTEEHLAGREPIHVHNEIKVVRSEKFKAAGCVIGVLQPESSASNEFKRFQRYSPELKCVLTEQVGRATGFGRTFHPISELAALRQRIAR